MNLKQALGQAKELLAAGNIDDASLEGELLLRHTLRIDRAHLYINLNHKLSSEQAETFWNFIKRRLCGEPAAYITGHREFYGLDFHVDPRVLIPRPESELLVEKALAMARQHPASVIAEIGTGCGAIAISLALNLPETKIYATDISAPALEVALINCQGHGVGDRICLLQGDMLHPLPETVDMIVANLPYVKRPEVSQTGLADFEPQLALDGGSDGLNKVHRLCRQASSKLNPQGCLLLEIGQGQENPVTTFLRGLFPSAAIEITPDLSGIERVVIMRLTHDCSGARLVNWALSDMKE